MQKIASFTINHDTLEKGLYVSRVDGDVITYDIRMKKPNLGEYLSNAGLHSFEHIFATFVRNSPYADAIVYAGPMGCRTGFYLLMRDAVSHQDAIDLVRDALSFTASFTGEVPGSRKEECGNFEDHDLEEARAMAADMSEVLKDWTVEDLTYPN